MAFAIYYNWFKEPTSFKETIMEATKLKINLTEGTLEVEGSEGFVRAIYADFKKKLGNTDPQFQSDKPQPLPKRSGPHYTKTENNKTEKHNLDNVAHFTCKPLPAVFQ